MGRGGFHPVERLVAVRTEYDGERSFKARWVGFAPKDDTWVSQSDLNDDPATFSLSPSVARVLGVAKAKVKKEEEEKKSAEEKEKKSAEEKGDKPTSSTKDEKKVEKKPVKKVEKKPEKKTTEKGKESEEGKNDVADAKKDSEAEVKKAGEQDEGENKREADMGEMKGEEGERKTDESGKVKKEAENVEGATKEPVGEENAGGAVEEKEADSDADVQMEEGNEPESQPKDETKDSVKENGGEEQGSGSDSGGNVPSASADGDDSSVRRSSRIRTSMKRLVEEMDATPRPTPKRRRKSSTPENPRKKTGKGKDSGEFWAVERILGSRDRGAAREFKIRWKGFSWRFDTWVAEKDLEEPPLMYPMALPLKRKLQGESRRKST